MRFSKIELDQLSYKVLGAAIEVHKALGPGLLESVYHKCLKQELIDRKIAFSSEHKVPIDYKGYQIEAELRLDFLVENILPIEIKAVDQIHPIHEAQLMSYMRLLKAPKGILVNFNVTNIFKYGQRTFVNEYYKVLE